MSVVENEAREGGLMLKKGSLSISQALALLDISWDELLALKKAMEKNCGPLAGLSPKERRERVTPKLSLFDEPHREWLLRLFLAEEEAEQKPKRKPKRTYEPPMVRELGQGAALLGAGEIVGGGR